MALRTASATVGSALPKIKCNAMNACIKDVHGMHVLRIGSATRLVVDVAWQCRLCNAGCARVATAATTSCLQSKGWLFFQSRARLRGGTLERP